MMTACCCICEKTLDEVKLYKCPICFKYVCDDHTYRTSGRDFCSEGCARFFFFGDEED